MSNTVTIYSPEGEMFENQTRANARDLVEHAGWSYDGHVAAATPKPGTPAVTSSVTTSGHPLAEELTEEDAENVEVVETEMDYAEEQEVRAQSVNRHVPGKFTEADFADLPTKAAVQTYIEDTFPDAEFDKRVNREKLVAHAIRLAADAHQDTTLSGHPAETPAEDA
jgi:hypothetical protein